MNVVQRNGRQALSVRAWNILILKAIQLRSKTTSQRLIVHLSDFSPIYYGSLQRPTMATGALSEITVTDINQAYVSIKLWLLLARSCVVESGAGPESVVTVASDDNSYDERAALSIWNELWPPFERLLHVYDVDTISAEVSVSDNPIATKYELTIVFLLATCKLYLHFDSERVVVRAPTKVCAYYGNLFTYRHITKSEVSSKGGVLSHESKTLSTCEETIY